jgi:hypothetical protein
LGGDGGFSFGFGVDVFFGVWYIGGKAFEWLSAMSREKNGAKKAFSRTRRESALRIKERADGWGW